MNFNTRVLSMLGACGAYGLAACELPSIHDNIAFFTADLQNFSGLDRFARAYPDKFYNVGIAEQNLLNVAAGFASEGNIAFASTYASFACTRCLDQVSVSMAYMGLNVKLVGLTSGFSVGILGPTHESLSDLSIMQSFPNITILSPADGIETVKSVMAAAEITGPVYIRFTGTMNLPIVYKTDFDYKVGKAVKLRDGSDVSIIATGTMVAESLKASEILAEHGLSASVYDMHTIRPLDKESIIEASKSRLLVTAEEHSIVGGLGTAVDTVIVDNTIPVKRLKIGVPCEFSAAASYKALLEKYGLTASQIADSILAKIGEC